MKCVTEENDVARTPRCPDEKGVRHITDHLSETTGDIDLLELPFRVEAEELAVRRPERIARGSFCPGKGVRVECVQRAHPEPRHPVRARTRKGQSPSVGRDRESTLYDAAPCSSGKGHIVR